MFDRLAEIAPYLACQWNGKISPRVWLIQADELELNLPIASAMVIVRAS